MIYVNVLVQPCVLIRYRSSQLGCESLRSLLLSYTLMVISDSRRDVQQCYSCQGNGYHFLSCLDIELHDRPSHANCIRCHWMEVLSRVCHLWFYECSVLLGVHARNSWYPSRRYVPFLSIFTTLCSRKRIVELDAYFEKVPLFVPGSTYHLQSAAAREEELRRGRVAAGHGSEEDVEKGDLEKGDVKHIESN